MSLPETRLLAAAAAAALAMAGFGARAAELRGGERYALVDPAAFRSATPTAKAPITKPQAVARKGKTKASKGKKILAGFNNYRMPAQAALERIGRPAAACQPAERACPAVFRDSPGKSQAWRDAAPSSPPGTNVSRQDTDMAAGEQANLKRAAADVPGLVPGRESSYKFTLNLPLGRYENVLLQANLRRNVYNTDNGNDSTLRADWSMQF